MQTDKIYVRRHRARPSFANAMESKGFFFNKQRSPGQTNASSEINKTDIAMTTAFNNSNRLAAIFARKPVHTLSCRYCTSSLCSRAMKALLLADEKTMLFSTDACPDAVLLVEDEYLTESCACGIQDMACRCCGNIVGYHVVRPCDSCLRACNNGHLYMFHGRNVVGHERIQDHQPNQPLQWGQLPPPSVDSLNSSIDDSIACCR
eukprot:TRINITY_DN24226_c0_g1_i1.p1 TRINITY_DN24226_c0_g1~~TRINITY_DN24226_c0_g1_i1.p1  ORF type:complete len:205 (+),score=26.05 TRINITY_DN24226_c0_g1_i1:1-615(+)